MLPLGTDLCFLLDLLEELLGSMSSQEKGKFAMLFISCVIPETARTMLFGENQTMAIQEGIQHCILDEWKHFERYIFAASKVECEPNKDCGPTYTFN